MEKSTILTDLPEYCLDKILSVLSLADLTNIAESNVILRNSAVRVFNWTFKKHPIFYSEWGMEKESVASNPNDFLRMIKYFGADFNKLHMYDVDDDRVENQMVQYELSRRCNSLTTLYITTFSGFIIKNQFTSVEKLIYHSRLGRYNSSWSDLYRWFPNLKTLEIRQVGEFVPELIAKIAHHIPSLEHFHCAGKFTADEDNLRHFIQFFNVNPQLNSLELVRLNESETGNNSLHFLLSSTDWNPTNIQELKAVARGILRVPGIN